MNMNGIKSILISFVSVSILFFALTGFAQNGTIKVKCVDSSSTPIPAVNIAVSSVGNQKPKEKKSDSKGEAEFVKLDDGVYRVAGHKEGFEPALFEFVTLKGSTQSVTLKLSAGADKKLYFEDPAQAEKASELLNQGLALYKESKFPDAEKLFSQAAELDPANPEYFRYLGLSLLQQGKFDQAVEALNRTAKISAVFAAAPQEAGRPAPAQYQQIVDGVQVLLKQLPVLKARSALREKNFDEAIAQFAEALKSDPNNPDLYSNMAIAQANLAKIDEALSSINKALELKPGDKEFEDLKNKISAIKQKNEAAKSQQAMLLAIEDGNKQLQSGDTAGALKKYQEADSLLSQEDKAMKALVWRQIGRVQAKLNQPDAAIEAFKKSIEFAPDEKTAADCRKSFAQFYLDQKKYEEAVNVLADTKTSDAQNLEPVLLSIFKDSKNSEPKLAEIVMERVIKINPQNADAYFELGQLYYMDGKAMDSRTKELFAKYLEVGKDQDKLNRLKDMMVIINRRSK
jgi:tetratricopeptide (TPR) repeat protein